MRTKIFIARDKWGEAAGPLLLFVGDTPPERLCHDGEIEFFPPAGGRKAMAVLLGVEIPIVQPGECFEAELRIKTHADVQAQDENREPIHAGAVGSARQQDLGLR